MNTLYETIKTYGTGKGEDMMWQSVSIISDFVEEYLSEEEKDELIADIYGLMSGGHYDEHYAMQCVKKMFYSEKDTKHYAPYWSEPQVREIYEKVKDKIPSYNFWDYYVTFQMIASDHWILYHTWWPDITPEVFAQKVAEASVNWLADQDWADKDKIWAYLHK